MKRILVISLFSLAACGSDLDVNVHGLPSDSNGTATSTTQQPTGNGNDVKPSNGNQQVVNPNSPNSSDGNFQVVDPNTGVVQQNPNAVNPNTGNSNTVANANDSNAVTDPDVDCQSGSAAGYNFNAAFLASNPNKTFVDAQGLYDYRYGTFTVKPVTQRVDECYLALKGGMMSALVYGTCHNTWSMSGYSATYQDGTVTFTGYNDVVMVLNDDGTGKATLADGTQCTLVINPS